MFYSNVCYFNRTDDCGAQSSHPGRFAVEVNFRLCTAELFIEVLSNSIASKKKKKTIHNNRHDIILYAAHIIITYDTFSV